MIELEAQFKIVISSVVFSLCFSNIYRLIDVLLRNSKIFRFVLEISFFLFVSALYYLLVYKINKGILNVYMPISLIAGYYLYMRFYDKHFSCLYKYLFSKLHSIIDVRKDKCKKLWKELKKKKIKKVEQTE